MVQALGGMKSQEDHEEDCELGVELGIDSKVKRESEVAQSELPSPKFPGTLARLCCPDRLRVR